MTSPTDSKDEIPQHLVPFFKKYRAWGAAIKANDLEAVRALLTYLSSQSKVDSQQLDRALVALAPEMSVEMADLLMEMGATLTEKIEGQDAVQAALSGKNTAFVLHFLDKGLVEPDHAEADGTTLLMAALVTEQYDLADQILARGADINRQRLEFSGGADTALHLAARQASFQSVIWLIENGADPAIENAARQQPCESIPDLDDASSREWDLDAMFDALEDYKAARKSGTAFEVPERMREMAYLEATPVSSMEAKMAELSAREAIKEEKSVGLIPKKKKIGF